MQNLKNKHLPHNAIEFLEVNVSTGKDKLHIASSLLRVLANTEVSTGNVQEADIFNVCYLILDLLPHDECEAYYNEQQRKKLEVV